MLSLHRIHRVLNPEVEVLLDEAGCMIAKVAPRKPSVKASRRSKYQVLALIKTFSHETLNQEPIVVEIDLLLLVGR